MNKFLTVAATLAASCCVFACKAPPPASANLVVDAQANVALPAGNRAGPVDPPTLTINNRSPHAITSVFIAAVNSNQWGEDVLDPELPLAAGDSTEVGFDRIDATHCNWDVRLTVEGQVSHDLRNLDLCATRSVSYSE